MDDMGDVEAVLGHLEKDLHFQQAVSLLGEGVISRGLADPACRAYRRYTREVERFTDHAQVLQAVLDDVAMKIWFFRVFGYRGDLQFRIMPAVWIRELTLLDIGRDAHIGYGVMLGTSRILNDGDSVLLRRIAIGERCFFNQHGVVEGGASIGSDCSIGIRSTIGADSKIGDGVEIGDVVRIGEEASIGDGCRIGCGASVGAGSIVDPGVVLEDGRAVPAHHRLTFGGLFPMPHRRIAA